MLIKLIGLLVAGVFVGATIYEVTHRRATKKRGRLPEQTSEEPGEQTPAP